MGYKYFRTKCYWYNEYQDMNAIVPTCDYYEQYGSCPCSDECEHYISEQEVEKIIRKFGVYELGIRLHDGSVEVGKWMELLQML